MLPERRPPWKEFVCSLGTQSLLLFAVAWMGVLHPEILIPPTHDLHFIGLVNNPPPVPQQPAPVKLLKAPIARLENPSPHALRLPPELKAKTPDETPEPPQVAEFMHQPEPEVAPTQPVIPRQLVKTNVFSNGSSANPTVARAPQQVQTGGFGDPNGVPAHENNGRPITIAQAGSFDLPSGAGYGNGTGGARGTRGVVASAGFGNGVATGDNSGRANTSRGNGVVRQGGFGDMEAAVAPVRTKAAESTPKVVPAEIISKPTPVYSDEARKLHIEGEVLLEVVFESSGKLRVVRVVRGLGHGLDEAAIQAAEQIHFKPALHDGQPADSNAVLHILFQLT